jgi:DNA-binding IclR family transcriptional regulator
MSPLQSWAVGGSGTNAIVPKGAPSALRESSVAAACDVMGGEQEFRVGRTSGLFRIVDMISRMSQSTNRAKDGAKSTNGVQAVTRALALLEQLGLVRDAGLAELAGGTGLQPSTAHRLLATLAAAGFVSTDPISRRYRLGSRLTVLGRVAEQREEDLIDAARPSLEALHGNLDETANLVILDGTTIVYIDQIESSRAVRMFSEVGNRVPAHASAAGKAMLAAHDDDALRRILDRSDLLKVTANTITDRDELIAELDSIRERGFAIDNGEFDDDVVCVAAPIVRGFAVVAALSVSGPAGRMRRHGVEKSGAAVKREARAASTRLYSPTPPSLSPAANGPGRTRRPAR